MSAVELVIKHEEHSFTVHSDNVYGVWVRWGTNTASVCAFVPVSAARELAAALMQAADASEQAQRVPA